MRKACPLSAQLRKSMPSHDGNLRNPSFHHIEIGITWNELGWVITEATTRVYSPLAGTVARAFALRLDAAPG
jgi:hypothetical protein